MFRFLFLGEGDVAPITREVLRKRISLTSHAPEADGSKTVSRLRVVMSVAFSCDVLGAL